MDIRLLQSDDELDLWGDWAGSHRLASLWQSSAWKRFQEALGREVRVYAAVGDGRIAAAGLVVIDRTAGGYATWNLPRGPLWDAREACEPLMTRILADAKRDKCISVYCSPFEHLPPSPALMFRESPRHEQPTATRILPLEQSDDELLAQMHQKGRYNIKVAEKHGITVRESRDATTYARLAAQTAARDGFRGAGERHYRTFLDTIPGSFLLLAFAPAIQEPVAGLIGVARGSKGIYYYGASDYAHRQLMAPYLLQWDAIKRCRSAHCLTYDLLGVAPPDSGDDHPWQGITAFKEKFGGDIVVYPPEQEIVIRPAVRGLLKAKRRLLG